MKRSLILAVAALFASGAFAADTYSFEVVGGMEPSLLPEGREFRLVWSDEFLDNSSSSADIRRTASVTVSEAKTF